MTVKFSEDVVPLTDLKANPGRVVRQVAESRRPVLLTSRGRGVAVVQSVAEFEAAEEGRAFMRAVVEGPVRPGGGARAVPRRGQGAARSAVADGRHDPFGRVGAG